MIPSATRRLRFREMTSGDLDDVADMLGDPRVMRYYPAPKTRDQASAWVDWTRRNYAEHGYGLWIIETHDGQFIGDCGLTWQTVNGVQRLEVGYHVRTGMQGHGYATEAALACLDLARDHLKAPEVVAIIHPDNTASRRVAAKLGMTHAEDHRGGDVLNTVYCTRF